MTEKQRQDLRQKSSSANLHQSRYDNDTQLNHSHKVKHVSENRTIVDGKTYYGHSAAAAAIENLKTK